MKSFLKNIMVSIYIGIEILKSFLIMCLVLAAIVTALSAVIHNVFKIREIYAEDKLGYKKLVTVSNNRMNVQVVGEGERTAIILSSFGTPSPIIQYKACADTLAANGYRVVIIEYFGYGYSLSTKDSRTLAAIASEVNEALTNSNIYGPYTLIACGISGLYAETYANNYPDQVERLILIDSVYAASIDEAYMRKYIDELSFNITLTSWAEMTGYARIMSYVKPDMFGIDKMQELGYSNNDISVYRKMIANRFYTATMKREFRMLSTNMEMLKNYVFPEYLPVTQIFSSEYSNEFAQYKAENLMKKDLDDYAEGLITNSQIQKIVSIDGEKENLNLSNPGEVVSIILEN